VTVKELMQSSAELEKLRHQGPEAVPTERQILGINFYVGDVDGVFERLSQGGLLVVPAAPALKDVAYNQEYRDALLNADVAIADSAFMVLLWNWMQADSIPRLSGLKYLRAMLQRGDVRKPGTLPFAVTSWPWQSTIAPRAEIRLPSAPDTAVSAA